MYGYDDGYPTMAERFGGAFLRTGGGVSPAAAGGMSELPAAAGAPGAGGTLRDALHPSTGLFVLFAIGAVSFGLMAFSTTVRVGHAEAHAGVGQT